VIKIYIFFFRLGDSFTALLQKLAKVFEDELLPDFLPVLKEALQNQEWQMVELGIFALIIVGENCKTGMEDHLAELLPIVIRCLSHEKAAVRAISCRTFTFYENVEWVVRQPHDQYLEPVMTELLKRILDGNMLVQKEACWALETFEV